MSPIILNRYKIREEHFILFFTPERGTIKTVTMILTTLRALCFEKINFNYVSFQIIHFFITQIFIFIV